MNAGGRPPGIPNDDDASARVRAAELAREEEMHLRASSSHHGSTLETIRMRHKVHKMTRQRLIQIYGRDLVAQALAS